MGIRAQIEQDYHASLAALAWQVELGADEAICESPQSAYDLPQKSPAPSEPARRDSAPKPDATAAPPVPANQTAVAQAAASQTAMAAATRSAAACPDLIGLEAAASQFDYCDLRKSARRAVTGLGHERAAILVLCDPPNWDAEKEGAAMDRGELSLFAKIFGAIGHSLDAPSPQTALHLAPVLPWPLRGTPESHSAALAMMRPFVLRRIALVAPKVVVVMGHQALASVLQISGLTRARGAWHALADVDMGGLAAAPQIRVMQDPASIAKSPEAKRAAWQDVLAIKSILRG